MYRVISIVALLVSLLALFRTCQNQELIVRRTEIDGEQNRVILMISDILGQYGPSQPQISASRR